MSFVAQSNHDGQFGNISKKLLCLHSVTAHVQFFSQTAFCSEPKEMKTDARHFVEDKFLLNGVFNLDSWFVTETEPVHKA